MLRGNPGKRPYNQREPQPELSDVEPLESMTVEAEIAEWKRTAPELTKVGLLTDLDKPAFAQYCYHYCQWDAVTAEIRRTGLLVVEQRDPDDPDKVRVPFRNPLLPVAAEHSKMMLRYLTEFGMTPSSRSRTQAAATKGPKSPWDDL